MDGVKHLTPQELAERWHTTEGTLKNWRAAKPPWAPRYIKFGKRVLYPLTEVEAVERRRLRDAVSVCAFQEANP